MPKSSLLIKSDLQILEKEIKEYLNVSQKELKETYNKNAGLCQVLCASYSSPPLRQVRSPLHSNFFA